MFSGGAVRPDGLTGSLAAISRGAFATSRVRPPSTTSTAPPAPPRSPACVADPTTTPADSSRGSAPPTTAPGAGRRARERKARHTHPENHTPVAAGPPTSANHQRHPAGPSTCAQFRRYRHIHGACNAKPRVWGRRFELRSAHQRRHASRMTVIPTAPASDGVPPPCSIPTFPPTRTHNARRTAGSTRLRSSTSSLPTRSRGRTHGAPSSAAFRSGTTARSPPRPGRRGRPVPVLAAARAAGSRSQASPNRRGSRGVRRRRRSSRR